jgi:hypothetical protein
MLPNSGSGSDAFGAWSAVASKVAKVAIAIGKVVPGVSEAADVLNALVEVEDSDSGLLKSIKADTVALRNKHFKAGVRSLREATLARDDEELWKFHIDRAQHNLHDAIDLVNDDEELAQVELNLAIVYLAKGNVKQAQRRLAHSSTAANRAVASYLRKPWPWWEALRALDAEDKDKNYQFLEDHRSAASDTAQSDKWMENMKGVTELSLVGLTVFGLGVGALTAGKAMEFYQVHKERQEIRKLVDFLDFYNLNEYLAAAVTPGRHANYVALIRMPDTTPGMPKYWLVDHPNPSRPQLPPGYVARQREGLRRIRASATSLWRRRNSEL